MLVLSPLRIRVLPHEAGIFPTRRHQVLVQILRYRNFRRLSRLQNLHEAAARRMILITNRLSRLRSFHDVLYLSLVPNPWVSLCRVLS